jgi:hypothetical protein
MVKQWVLIEEEKLLQGLSHLPILDTDWHVLATYTPPTAVLA